MSRSLFGTRFDQIMATLTAGSQRKLRRPKVRRSLQLESLEGRALLATINASATIASAVDGSNFNYKITLDNASSSDSGIGTFWYAWIPGQDYLATNPISVTPPTGWTDNITHTAGTPPDGFAIQFIATSASDDVPAGGSLNFSFVSEDAPASVNGNSVDFPTTPVGTSFVYPGAPFSDPGHEFVVTPAAPPTLQSIAVTPANTDLTTGNTEQFTATGTLSNDTTEDLTSQVTWASSDTTWATINTTGLATAVAPGPVTISAAFDGVTGSTGVTVVAPPTLQSIAVTPANTDLTTGSTEQFTATGTLTNDTTEDLTGQVTWTSSDITWATINTAGLATAVAPGPVTISAAFDGVTGSAGLTVVAPPTLQSIAVTPANTDLTTGSTEQFTATGTLSNNTTENLTSQVTWASSDTTWATINTAGLATAVAPGPVTISAAFDGVTGSAGLTVVAPPTLQSIAVTPVSTGLAAGNTEQFAAIGTLSNNTTENLTSQVTWASSDTTWATITTAGLATAVAPGPVTISAAFDGVTGSTGLTITAAILESIAVTPVNTNLVTGNTEQFTAIGTLSNNTTENLTSQVTWASSDTTWATINSTGLATAGSPGPVTISAAFDGVTGSTGLTVTPTPAPNPTPTQSAFVGQQPIIERKLNKKGKPTGKPVLTGFMLDLGVGLNPAAASNPANYQLDTVTTKKIKKKTEKILHPITKFSVVYSAATNAIQINLGAKEAFPTGGQITVLGGETTAAGGMLTGPAVFSISKGGKNIGPG